MAENEPSVVCYHFPPSLCSQKVRLALFEKGVTFTSRLVNIGPVMENYEPWYARLNPRMVVPTLVVGEEVITDSARIVLEVDRRFEGPDLGAAQPHVQRWVALQDGLAIRELSYSSTNALLRFLSKGSFARRREVLSRRAAEHPELAPLYLARLADVEGWQQVSTTPAEVAQARDVVRSALAEVEQALLASPFLASPSYSLADVVWTVVVARLRFLGMGGEMGPATTDWYARMRARESFDGADVWERPKPRVMLPLICSVLRLRLRSAGQIPKDGPPGDAT